MIDLVDLLLAPKQASTPAIPPPVQTDAPTPLIERHAGTPNHKAQPGCITYLHQLLDDPKHFAEVERYMNEYPDFDYGDVPDRIAQLRRAAEHAPAVQGLAPKINADKVAFVLDQLSKRGPAWARDYMSLVEGFDKWPKRVQRAVLAAEAASGGL